MKPPIIKECVSHLECRLHGKLEAGGHTIFVGDVILAYTNKNASGEKMIFHLGGNRFSTLARRVVDLKTMRVLKNLVNDSQDKNGVNRNQS